MNILDEVKKIDAPEPLDCNVTFELQSADGETLKSTLGKACYAELGTYLLANKSSKYLVRSIKNKEHRRLKKEDRLKWINLCITYGLILTDQEPEEVADEKLVTDLDDERYSSDRLYIDLCSYRFMWENPKFVKTILFLVDGGFDFWLSFIWAHGYNFRNANHSWLGFDSGIYSFGMEWNNQKNNIALAASQKKYLQDSHNRKCGNYKENCLKMNNGWSTRELMRVAKYMLPTQKVLVENHEDLLTEESRKKAEELLCTV